VSLHHVLSLLDRAHVRRAILCQTGARDLSSRCIVVCASAKAPLHRLTAARWSCCAQSQARASQTCAAALGDAEGASMPRLQRQMHAESCAPAA
jgi:hypothetical protein